MIPGLDDVMGQGFLEALLRKAGLDDDDVRSIMEAPESERRALMERALGPDEDVAVAFEAPEYQPREVRLPFKESEE